VREKEREKHRKEDLIKRGERKVNKNKQLERREV